MCHAGGAAGGDCMWVMCCGVDVLMGVVVGRRIGTAIGGLLSNDRPLLRLRNDQTHLHLRGGVLEVLRLGGGGVECQGLGIHCL